MYYDIILQIKVEKIFKSIKTDIDLFPSRIIDNYLHI